MSTDANSNKRFEEALQLLNEAAKEKKDEIQRLISDKYSYIKDAVQDATEDNLKKFNRMKKLTARAIEEGSDQAMEMVEDLDKQVRKNPWAYIGGAALGALLVGYIMGSSKNK